ncbi:AAA family ATPase [Aeromicrobium sp. CF3.5]|uniref:AAA family ATPase n=1 Tax=Aeromicrobium sp. CF3.5 TaxID=3373078 RepID=UPI003EE50089
MRGVLLVGGDGGLEYRLGRISGDKLQKVPLDEIFRPGFDIGQIIDPAAPPSALLLGPELDQETMLWIASSADALGTGTAVIAVAEPTPKLMAAAMRAGVREVLDLDAPDDELERVLLWARTHSSRLTAPKHVGVPHSNGRVVVVASPKGGVGKTTVAVNMAVELARIAPSQVVVVDLDLQFGDVATMLDLQPDHSIADVFASGGGLDTLMLKTYLAAHGSGLWLVAAPNSPAAADVVDASHVKELLQVLKGAFRYVVVDTGSGLDEPTLAALEVATDAVFVSNLDVSSVRNMRKEVEILGTVGLLPERHRLVVNMADRRSGMKPGDVSAVVGLPVGAVIPRSPELLLACNQGVPLLTSKKHGGAAAKSLRGFVTVLAAEGSEPHESV